MIKIKDIRGERELQRKKRKEDLGIQKNDLSGKYGIKERGKYGINERGKYGIKDREIYGIK